MRRAGPVARASLVCTRGCPRAPARAKRSQCRAAGSSTVRRLTSADLDAWARGPTVRGHAHSRPTFERYGLSLVREVGGGAAVPEDWAVRLLSATGAKGSEGPNQDAFSYTLLDSGWIVCVACDGHGEHGEVVAERVARALPLFLSPHLLEHDPEVALRRAFAEAQLDLERCFRSAQVYSGAAVAACCVHSERREAWTAHAGDSQVVLGDLGGGGVVCYTEEHKAHDPGELERLREAGAQVIQKRYDDGELVSRIFIPRTGIPGLAMSRSLGDGCLKKYGVCADPEVQDMSTLWRACAAPVLLLASDGLWDMVTPGAAVEVLASRCRSGLDVLLGVEVLLRRSQRLWIEAEGDYCDDVTVLLVVVAVARSKSMQLSEGGLSSLEAMGAEGESTDLKKLGEFLAGQPGKKVIIDNTAGEEPCEFYTAWLSSGCDVITPNKKVGSGPLARYKEAVGSATSGGGKFYYEATVGAGLPIITSLQDLIRTGDKVERIEGVFSGTLSFIFNTLTPDVAFSEVVKEAAEKGFTEPDPRDDLSGTDVQRKVTILARECGLELELDDVPVTSLVPGPLQSWEPSEEEKAAGLAASFVKALEPFDAEMATKVKAASENGEVLRYVGVIDLVAKKASVELRPFPKTDPFAGTQFADNIVVFKTARYTPRPLVVQGPGAGAAVTAGGVFADLLRAAA